MPQKKYLKESIKLGDGELSIETGKVAKQAPPPPVLVVEPEIEAPPEYTELDAARDQIEELQAKIAARLGYKLVDHRMELYGSPTKPSGKPS